MSTSTPIYTLDQIRDARKLVASLGLTGCGIFCLLSIDKVQSICNGIGAEWMPAWARKILDDLHPHLKIAAMIHDVQYQYGSGTDSDFHLANRNLKENGCEIAKYYHPWYYPTRYIAMRESIRLANWCELGGRLAYEKAIEARKKQEGF